MILYDFNCTEGHRFEAGVQSMLSENPACPICAAPTRRRPSTVKIGGRADAGPSRDQMPRSWQGVRNGDHETVAHWRELATKRERLEEKYPELAGDRRPVLAHEGIFSAKPLRAGDDVPKAVAEAKASGVLPHGHGATPL
ncbi:zinc ribbon domain-containing protein [Arthrobacter echini]|uniref:Zinc ribbon domain-containing protein n=1 Tax=Arthrobacter echini TaxID=1529066 RepID=A0A4S5E0S7_9MICC|nr:zinc ribbon domain-containing protein [Arthrobacter echini]THJ64928.1 zinc ribbon domain-containing protein [Arthrobacter echini]